MIDARDGTNSRRTSCRCTYVTNKMQSLKFTRCLLNSPKVDPNRCLIKRPQGVLVKISLMFIVQAKHVLHAVA